MNTKHLISTLAVAGSVTFAVASSASAATTDPQTAASGNWSGYAVGAPNGSNEQFTSVSGSWTEPSANCNAGQGVASFWVGLGGAGQDSQALEQTGTEVDCSSGMAKHIAWYELIPSAPVNFNLAISAGDHMSARVTVDGRNVTMYLKDDTTGQSASKTLQTNNIDTSSAEWIAEAPSQCDGSGGCTPMPLADFGKVDFTSSSATAGGHTGTISDSAWQSQPIELSPGAGGGASGFVSDTSTSTAGAQPTGLSSDGSSFSVSWAGNATQVSTSGGSGGGYGGGSGYGGGYGAGSGYGDGSGYGYGGGSGYGDGSGYGYGGGSGYGDGSGSGPTVILIYGAGYGY